MGFTQLLFEAKIRESLFGDCALPPVYKPCDADTGLEGDERRFCDLIPERKKRLVWAFYCCEESTTQADAVRLLEQYDGESVSRPTIGNWARALKRQFELWRDPPLDEIEDRTGSPAKCLRGALADTGSTDVGACPDQIAGIVAAFYALTRCGRLFHWRHGKLKELDCGADGRFTIRVAGVRWRADQNKLLNRLFPDRAIEPEGEIDWSEYDPSDRLHKTLPVDKDPLEENSKPADSWVVSREMTPDGAIERAERLFWGTGEPTP